MKRASIYQKKVQYFSFLFSFLLGVGLTEGHKSLIRYLLGRPVTGSTTEVNSQEEQEEVNKARKFECEKCAQNFCSLNRLRKHRRLGCDKDKVQKLEEIAIPREGKPPVVLGSLEPKTEEYYFQGDQTSIPLHNYAYTQASSMPMMPSKEIDQDFVPTWAQAIPSSANSPFIQGMPVEPTKTEVSPMAKRLLTLGEMCNREMITKEQKQQIKDLILQGDEIVAACWDAFAVDNDVEELVDSLLTVLQMQ